MGSLLRSKSVSRVLYADARLSSVWDARYRAPQATCETAPGRRGSPRSRTVLLRIGFTFARCCHSAGELLPRLSILTLSGGLFLLHFPGSRLRRTLSVILPFEARTFLMPIPFGAVTRDSPTYFTKSILDVSLQVKRRGLKFKNILYLNSIY